MRPLSAVFVIALQLLAGNEHHPQVAKSTSSLCSCCNIKSPGCSNAKPPPCCKNHPPPPSPLPLASQLWPRPQQLMEKTAHSGFAQLYNDWIIAYNVTNYNDSFAATGLHDFLEAKTNGSLRLPLVPLRSISASNGYCNTNTTTSCKFIAIGNPEEDRTLAALATARNLSLPADLDRNEGYVLDVGEQEDPANGNYVMILAHSAAGRYFGVQTLIQMINTSVANGASLDVPAARIVDWPQFPVRGFLMSGLGEKMPTPFFYEDAARMTRNKMNFAFLEFMENVPYSPDQYQMMLDIQAHCKQRHMYIVPQVPDISR
jgi:hypothetical protein